MSSSGKRALPTTFSEINCKLIRRSTARIINENTIVYKHFSYTRGISAIKVL